jgi:hypothetical protein
MAGRRSTVPDRAFEATSALFAARAFHGTAQMLEEIRQHNLGKLLSLSYPPAFRGADDSDAESFDRWARSGIPISAVVLEALALELILKVRLDQASKPVPKSHDHAVLYADLPAAEKEEAARRYRNSRDPPMPTTLAEVLTESAKAFEQWRYIHEQKQVGANPEDMRRAFEALAHGRLP